MYRHLSLIVGFFLACLSLNAQNDCQYQLILNDAGGDGWQGAGITFVSQTTTNPIIDTTEFTLIGFTDTVLISLVEGDSISLIYLSGPDNGDNNFQLLDSDGQVLIESSDPNNGVLFEGFASCPICPAIVLGSQMNIDSFDNRVLIDWDASDSLGIYQIEYARCGFLNNPDSILVAQSSISEATITGLAEKTCYEYQISLVCLAGDTSIVSGVNQINTIFTRDVGISGAFAPQFGQKCDFLAEDTLIVFLKNFGAAPQTLVPFDFTLTFMNTVINSGVTMPDDGLFTGVLAKDSCMAFPFETPINISEPGEYTITMTTSLPGDSDETNDAFTYTFSHTLLLPFSEGFDDNTLPERWSSDEVDPFGTFLNNNVVSSILGPLNSRFELTTARYGRIAADDTLKFDYVFAAADAVTGPLDLVVGDQLIVEISTDCGENYELISTIDMNTVNPNLAQNFSEASIPLAVYEGDLVDFRFTALRGGTNFRIVLDNINVNNCVDGSILANESITNSSTEQEENGIITVVPSGGVAPYTFVWSNSMDVTTGNSSTVTGLAEGSFSVTITDIFDCSSVFTYDIGIVATQELADLIDFNIYPNPAQSVLQLELTLAQSQDIAVNIYNAIGQQMWSTSLAPTLEHQLSISLAQFNDGLYFIQLSSAQGQITRKFVVER